MKSKANKNNSQPKVAEKNESTNSAASESTNQHLNDLTIRPVEFSTDSDVVIRVENLWKEYRLGTINHGTLAQDLNSWWAKVRGKEDPNQKLDSAIQQINDSTAMPDRFWALRDVSFDVKQGEVLGIIGKNGAGKSTLLKIISQVTTPTRGQINIKGRVASLLEVGTGFHPELTGQENVFLNGAILGMSKAEIRSKFDEIVAFAEVEKFIDTPVKRYSSGMYVRLAFAVAAHLEPEILIVDEVLAVGDAQFQKKCLGKMKQVGNEGRTVLFVSHNLTAVQNLCPKTILLKNGELVANDATSSIVEKYLNLINKLTNIPISKRTDRQGNGLIRFSSLCFKNRSGEKLGYCVTGNFIIVNMMFNNFSDSTIKNTVFGLGINDNGGNRIAVFNSEACFGTIDLHQGKKNIEIIIPKFPFTHGKYTYTIFCSSNGVIMDWIQNAGSFLVEPGDYYGTGIIPSVDQGKILIDYKLKIE